VYLDDKFAAFLERDWQLGRAILPYIIDFFGRPKDPNEPLVRNACLSMSKFRAEAMPEETKIMLGWLLDTRKMVIALPDNKVQGWTALIDKMLASPSCSAKALEELIGRLEHVCYVIPGFKHFLGDLCAAHQAAKRAKSSHCILRNRQLQGLHLWKGLLAVRRRGHEHGPADHAPPKPLAASRLVQTGHRRLQPPHR
jgi:hypothetical protein